MSADDAGGFAGRPTPRVTYWTGTWEPRREAISKEVAWLRGELAPNSLVVLYTLQPTQLRLRERVLCLNGKRWLLLRAAAVALERIADVTHIFGGLDTITHFLEPLGRRPILCTIVIPGDPVEIGFYDRVSQFVVESRSLAASLVGAGVPRDRIEVIYPAVDIDRHAPCPPPAGGRFRLLFASTPSDPAEIDARGLGLLIDLARLRPDIDVIVPWRQWGSVGEARDRLESRQPPRNFRVEHGDVTDMTSLYREVHATVCCFAAGFGKSAPNSVVEGLASGRPALLAETCGIADLIGEWQAGIVTPRTAADLAEGVDKLRGRYESACLQARRLAEHEFDSRRAVQRYARLYHALAVRPGEVSE